jgi:hypothetical protein
MARGGNVDIRSINIRNIAVKNGSLKMVHLLVTGYALNRGGRKQGGKYEESDGVHN